MPSCAQAGANGRSLWSIDGASARQGCSAARPCAALSARGSPGAVVGPGVRVACGSGVLEIAEGQLPGKRAMAGRDLANGARLALGEVLG